MITNCTPCFSCRRQDLACSCGEKLPNTRPVSQAAGYPQVLHVMVSQEKAVAETNPCAGEKCAWFSLKAGEQSRWSSVRTCPALCLATETRHRSELSIKETEYYEANNCHLSQDACQGRIEPAGQGMNLSNPFSWWIQLAGSSREHPLSHYWMLFYLFNTFMFSHTFTPPLLLITLSSGLQEHHRSGLSRGFRYTLLWGHWRNESVC